MSKNIKNMMIKLERLLPVIKRAMKYSFSVVAFANIILGVIGYTIRDISESLHWLQCVLILIAVFVLITILMSFWFYSRNKRMYVTKIDGCKVEIKVGDIFTETDWKVIGFNEFFDTEVGSGIIEEDSLNGILITEYIGNRLPQLQERIKRAQDDSSSLKGFEKRGKIAYPLGRVIDFEDFLILALSHFSEQNTAYIELEEYEQLLMNLWKELRRVYNGKHIAIPLLGTGVMDINGMPEKDYTALLHCILCSLHKSSFKPKNGLTIVLTDEAISRIDMNAIKSEF